MCGSRPSRPRRPRALPCALLTLALAGCVRAPDIVVQDRRSALEEQAAGRPAPLDDELARALLRPSPEPLSAADASAASGRAERLDSLLQWADPIVAELEAIDDWLIRGCAGEGRGGLLVETPEACRGAVDRVYLAGVLRRENEHRSALWRALAEASRRASLDAIRQAWRARRLQQVPCEGQVESPAGTWERKRCE